MKDTLETFVKKAIIKHNNKYHYSNVVYVNSKTKITVICKKHGEFKITPSNHLFGTGCKQCNIEINRKDIVNFIKESHLIHGLKYNYDYAEYKSNKVKIKIICVKHGEFLQTPKNHLNGHGCPNCAIDYKSNKRKLSQEEFENKSNKMHNNFYDYSKSKYINSKNKVIIICPKHGEFKQSPTHHISGVGCSKCSGNNKSSTIDFINKSVLIHSKKYNYSKVKYINSKNKVIIICPKHGEFKQSPSHHLMGVGCSICNESKGEKKIREILNTNNVFFNNQKQFNECINPITKNKLKFDFYLIDYNTCIEYDGMQHFKPIKYFGGEKHFNKLKVSDKIKNEFCNKNNIKLIRIKYNENIYNKLKKELGNIIN